MIVEYTEGTPTTDLPPAANARCPDGKRVLGGGAFVGDQQSSSSSLAVLSSSRPSDDGERWFATTTRLRTDVTVNGALTGWAICADVTP